MARIGAALALTGQWQGLAKGLGRAHGVLALHGVNGKQGLNGFNGRVNGGDFGHHGLVDGKPACRVDQKHVMKMSSCVVERRLCDRHWLVGGLTWEKVGPGLFAYQPQLFNGCRSVDVTTHGENLLLMLALKVLGKLTDAGGLSSALQASH